MRILQVVKTSEGALWAFHQADALIKRGMNVITVMPDLKGNVAKRYLEKGYPLIEADFSLPISKPFSFIERVKNIKRIIAEVKPDLIHCHFVTNIIMMRIALRQDTIPRIFQVPGPLHLESFLFRMLDIYTATQSDYWIGTCNKTVQLYRDNKIPADRVFLGYYGGYGGNECDSYCKSGDALHREYKINRQYSIIGMVSYVYRPKWYALQRQGIKGHEDFIKAISIVRKTHPYVMAVIIGGPWGKSQAYYEKIKAYANRICGDNIIFTGTRKDIKEIYCELDVVVHPSHSENLGGAAESLAAARPTISTNVGGFPDIVRDGETGYTVPAKKPKELAKAICKMLNDMENAEQMAHRGQEKVRELLDISNTAKTINNIYCKILKLDREYGKDL